MIPFRPPLLMAAVLLTVAAEPKTWVYVADPSVKRDVCVRPGGTY